MEKRLYELIIFLSYSTVYQKQFMQNWILFLTFKMIKKYIANGTTQTLAHLKYFVIQWIRCNGCPEGSGRKGILPNV